MLDTGESNQVFERDYGEMRQLYPPVKHHNDLLFTTNCTSHIIFKNTSS